MRFPAAITIALTLFGGVAHAQDFIQDDPMLHATPPVPQKPFGQSSAGWLSLRLDAITPTSSPALLVSYDVLKNNSAFDIANANTAYTYDQALAIMALVATHDAARARRIGDALLWDQAHDRQFNDGRLRNAYAAGLAVDTPAKLPGYYDQAKAKWIEDSYADGAATGNNAWAGVALMHLADATHDDRYAEGARRIGHWLIDVVLAGDPKAVGFPGGFEGFDPEPQRLTWVSTEHNCAVLALMRRLAARYPGEGFEAGAKKAEAFIRSQWQGDHFAVGTTIDGHTTVTDYVSLDTQVLPQLALLPDASFKAATAYAKRKFAVEDGYDYSASRKGIWVEGTEEMHDLIRVTPKTTKPKPRSAASSGIQQLDNQEIMEELVGAGNNGQARYAVQGIGGASLEELPTGLTQGNGEGPKWSYFHRIAVAPTAWAEMAQTKFNPLSRP